MSGSKLYHGFHCSLVTKSEEFSIFSPQRCETFLTPARVLESLNGVSADVLKTQAPRPLGLSPSKLPLYAEHCHFARIIDALLLTRRTTTNSGRRRHALVIYVLPPSQREPQAKEDALADQGHRSVSVRTQRRRRPILNSQPGRLKRVRCWQVGTLSCLPGKHSMNSLLEGSSY